MTASRPARPKVREEVAALKRQRTLDAATDLFYEQGYTNTTLDHVAQRLGVTKPFIYNNFGSKHELLAEICGLGVRSALDEIEAALAPGPATVETLRRFAPRYLASVLRTQKNIAINIREEKNLLPEHAAELAMLRQTFMQRIETLVSDVSRAEGIVQPNPRVTAFAVVGAVSWSTFWFNPAGPLSVDDLAEKMTGIILNMIAGAPPAA